MNRSKQLAAAGLIGLLLVGAVVGGLRAYASFADRPPGSFRPSNAAYAGPLIVINEIAWMGTEASPSDEWIELHNTTSAAVCVDGWHLVDDDHLDIELDGTIPPRGFYLIERTDDAPVGDIPGDWTGSFGLGGLSNAGEVLTLTDALEAVIDVVDASSGWPAGTASSGTPCYATMERVDPTGSDSPDNWCTHDGLTCNGVDADGQPINGTPRAPNSCYLPPPPPAADLRVAKHGPRTVRRSDPITYRIIITNAGSLTARETVLTDALPGPLSVIGHASPLTVSQLGRLVVWQLGDLAPGRAHTLTLRTCISQEATASLRLVNVVTATTSVSETNLTDNVAHCTTTVAPVSIMHLPVIAHHFTAPLYGPIIEAFLYDGLQVNDYDEAVLLLNGRHLPLDLTGWQLCKLGSDDWTCADLPGVALAPYEWVWMARSATYFPKSFGFELPEEQILSPWPRLTNGGDELALIDPDGAVRDLVVYKDGLTDLVGWSGPAVQPYAGAAFAEEGQILFRRLDEATGRPAADTDTAADWAQYRGAPSRSPLVRYPGWDLERFFQPAVAASGHVTVGIAPDHAYDLVADTIRSARDTIEIEAYTLEHPALVAELVSAASRGVSVTVLLEGGPVGGIQDQELWACQQLHTTGRGTCAFMIRSDNPEIHSRYRYIHNKVMIVDRRQLLLGSQNFAPTSLPADDKANGTGGSRGVILVTDAPDIVARAVEIFEADCDPEHHEDVDLWGPENTRGYGPPPSGFAPDPDSDWLTYTVRFSAPITGLGSELELMTAPETALRTSDGLLGLIGRAGPGDGIAIEQLYEHVQWGTDASPFPNPRLQASVEAARRGARVRILLNGGTFDLDYLPLTDNIETAAYVNELAEREGLDLSAHLGDPTHYGIHNKMVLVDLDAEGKFIHVGSINGSETSSKANREMALQVRSEELYDYLYDLFEYDWGHQTTEGHLLISEVMINPDGNDPGREWIEVYNPTVANVDLSGWTIGDVGPKGEYGSGLYRFPDGATLVAEGVIVLAHQAEDVYFTPDYEFLVDRHRDDPSVPNMVPAGSWDGFGLALGNDGDEVLLLNADGDPVDVVVYGTGKYVGVVPYPDVPAPGLSLERRPPREDTDDCSVDFYDRYPPTPGTLPD